MWSIVGCCIQLSVVIVSLVNMVILWWSCVMRFGLKFRMFESMKKVVTVFR